MSGFSPTARLTAAEGAIAAGKLEDAVNLLSSSELDSVSSVVALRERLVDALLARASAHEAAGRYAEALTDLDRAAAVGARSEVVAGMRDWIRGVADREQRVRRQERQQVEAARARIDAGSLAAGREMLGDLDAKNTQVRRLQQAAEQRERDAERRIDEARRFLDASRFGQACEAILRALTANPKSDEAMKLASEAAREVIERVREAVSGGRLPAAFELFAQLGGIGQGLIERSEWERILKDLRSACESIGGSDWSAARRTILRLKSLLPDASWLSATAEQLTQLDDLIAAIHAGPLGALLVPGVPGATADRAARSALDGAGPAADPLGETTLLVDRAAATPAKRLPVSPALASLRCRLLVDGAGSFLVLRADRVTIGRAGAESPRDIPLMADLSALHAEIARIDEDYFLFARKPVIVNGREVPQRLLEDGDRIELARHVRLRFLLPSRRSASAVLELGGSQRLSGDVRRVILFDRHATMGPGPANHIVVPGAERTVAILERAGNLYVLPASERGAERESAETTALADGVPVEVAGLRIVMRVLNAP